MIAIFLHFQTKKTLQPKFCAFESFRREQKFPLPDVRLRRFLSIATFHMVIEVDNEIWKFGKTDSKIW